MQPFGKPKYNNKSHKQGGADRQGFNSSFISGAGLEETSSTPNKQNVFTGVGISQKQMRNSMIQQQQNAPVKFLHYSIADHNNRLHHYRSGPNLMGETSGHILLENQNRYRNHVNLQTQ